MQVQVLSRSTLFSCKKCKKEIFQRTIWLKRQHIQEKKKKLASRFYIELLNESEMDIECHILVYPLGYDNDYRRNWPSSQLTWSTCRANAASTKATSTAPRATKARLSSRVSHADVCRKAVDWGKFGHAGQCDRRRTKFWQDDLVFEGFEGKGFKVIPETAEKVICSAVKARISVEEQRLMDPPGPSPTKSV